MTWMGMLPQKVINFAVYAGTTRNFFIRYTGNPEQET